MKMPTHEGTYTLLKKEANRRLLDSRHALITTPLRAYTRLLGPVSDTYSHGTAEWELDWATLYWLAPHMPLAILVLISCATIILGLGYAFAWLHCSGTIQQAQRPSRLSVLAWSGLVAVLYSTTMYVMLSSEAEHGMDIDEAFWQMLAGLAALTSAIVAVLFGAVMFVAVRKLAMGVYRDLYWPSEESEKGEQIALLPQA
nr:hypothetical protein B0A51_16626 [Rachicladosporium sp. CCFEE 5018]